MMPLEEDRALLDRLYARLTEALRERPDPYGAPVTVAELYQELVPYRTVRSDVGFAMNADYEHTLLRLLSGESERAKLEPPSAREEIRRELRSSNPNVSIYREYAACEVWITPPSHEEEDAGDTEAWLDSLSSGDDAGGGADPSLDVLQLTEDDEIEEPAEEERDAVDELQTKAGTRRVGDAGGAPAARGAEGPAAAAAAPRTSTAAETAARYAAAQQAAIASMTTGGNCVFCDSQLPAGRKVRYCPFCGGDQTMRPCGTCGEALEAGWAFCVACGAPATEA